mgnify:CR=1 FL=1
MIDTLVGNTPLVRMNRAIYAKFEAYNPSGSVKDRMAFYIVKKAEQRDELRPGNTIVEATSGNTGIAMAMVGAARGYKVIIIMPRNMSVERKQMIRAYGAQIIEVGDNAFADAIEMKEEMCAENESFFNPRQFSNPDNILCHAETTAKEILNQIPIFSPIRGLILGSGTGGTIMGLHTSLKERYPEMQTIQVQPTEDNASHGIQGINDGKDFLLDSSILDGVIKVGTQEALDRARLLAQEKGLLVGISSGANVLAAERWSQNRILRGGIVITMLCDRGERYLSCY